MSREYPAEVRQEAKRLCGEMSESDVAERLGIPYSTVHGWATRGTWDHDGTTRKWPPFDNGGRQALKHGATSDMKVQERIEEIKDELLDSAPWLRNPAFRHTVDAWLWAEAQCSLMREYIDEAGLTGKKAEQAANSYERCEGRAARLRRELGLTPVSFLRIIKSITEALKAAEGNLDALDEKSKAILRTQAAELRAVREQLHEAQAETNRQIAKNAMAISGGDE